jgi:hypothetical protein
MEQQTAYRLIYPARFTSERQAQLFAQNNCLDRVGAMPAEIPAAARVRAHWALVIDSDHALLMVDGLRAKFPNIAWIASRKPQVFAESP